jgi:hypothetical protein
MGGNDLNFSALIYYCVITPNVNRLGSTTRADCEAIENSARQLMNSFSTGVSEMGQRLMATYEKILRKASGPNFQLFVTGYPPFFNSNSTDCDLSTFHYWYAAYKPFIDWPTSCIVYLSTDLCRELNDLVFELNYVIQAAVDEVNKDLVNNKVHYVDLIPAFNTHHWCEPGSWHEPAPQVASTYFFLSGWPDVPIDGGFVDTPAEEAKEQQALVSQGAIRLPDADTCQDTLGDNSDPYAVAMCRRAQEVNGNFTSNATSLTAEILQQANEDIVAGIVDSQSISWWLPTRQIKTFHPRSPGQAAIRDSIIERMQDLGVL